MRTVEGTCAIWDAVAEGGGPNFKSLQSYLGTYGLGAERNVFDIGVVRLGTRPRGDNGGVAGKPCLDWLLLR